jgi:hypothetical protein
VHGGKGTNPLWISRAEWSRPPPCAKRIEEVRFARDSPLEGAGFEPSVPLQVLAVSGQPLVVSVTLPRFPFAKTESPFATGGPRVRILLPPAVSPV